MYLFRHLVETEYILGLSFTAPLCDSSKCLFVRGVQKSEFGVQRQIGVTVYDVLKCELYKSRTSESEGPPVFFIANRTDSVPNGSRLSLSLVCS
jgi:hypothetical protein